MAASRIGKSLFPCVASLHHDPNLSEGRSTSKALSEQLDLLQGLIAQPQQEPESCWAPVLPQGEWVVEELGRATIKFCTGAFHLIYFKTSAAGIKWLKKKTLASSYRN